MAFEAKVTGRGFGLVEFRDRNGQECTLQQSSAAFVDGEDHEPGAGAIWLGVGDERMHLSRADTLGLVEFMIRWMATGNFER